MRNQLPMEMHNLVYFTLQDAQDCTEFVALSINNHQFLSSA